MSNIFENEYLMYELYSFLDESDIINMKIVCKNIYESCKNYIEIEDNGRFEITNKWDNSELLEKYCKHNNVIKIRKLIKKSIKTDLEIKMNLNWNYGLDGACEGGHIDIIRVMIEKGADHWDWALFGASKGGHIDIVKFVIEKGTCNWDWGLEGACIGGYMNIVKLMIEKGCNDWNGGLCAACQCGHIDIVNLMIEKGGKHWNWGLHCACEGGGLDIVKLMIEKGATECGFGDICDKSMEEHLKEK